MNAFPIKYHQPPHPPAPNPPAQLHYAESEGLQSLFRLATEGSAKTNKSNDRKGLTDHEKRKKVSQRVGWVERPTTIIGKSGKYHKKRWQEIDGQRKNE